MFSNRSVVNRSHRRLLPGLVVVASALCMTLRVAEAVEDRPRIGLALGGGGAKGGAHIGVLKVLEELDIPIDYIAGTSMGAVVGGLYASGLSVEELEQELTTIDWDDALRDAPPREEMAFRRKGDEARYTVKLQLGLKKGKIVWPSGYMSGQKLYFLLQALTLPAARVSRFDDLPIPFRCVATDISTGDSVVIDHGNVATAIRASMAIPSVFAPVEWEGMTLVDGGIVDNLPVDVVRAMGADIVIAVDLGAPLSSRDVRSMWQIQKQLTRMQIRKNVEPQLDNADLVIRPDVSGHGTLDFSLIAENLALGVEATRAEADRLRPWSVGPEAFRRHWERQTLQEGEAPIIGAIALRGNRRVDDRVIRSRMKLRPGDTFDFDRLFDDISRIYGLGDFQQVSFRLEGAGDDVTLVIQALEKPWGPTYMNFGASLDADGEGDVRAGVLVDFTLTGLNRRGAEWRNDVELGSRRLLFTELYQPLDFGGRFFVSPRLGLDWDRRNLYLDGKNVAAVDTRQAVFGLDFGYDIPRYGEIRLGYDRRAGSADSVTGVFPPGFDAEDIDVGGIRLRIIVDRLDNFNVPRNGLLIRYRGNFNRERFGSDENYNRSLLDVGYWYSRHKNTVFGFLSGGWVNNGTLPFHDEFTLGGLFSLSGFFRDQLRGQYFGVGRLGYYRHVTSLWFLGGWTELGNAWRNRNEIGFDDTIWTATAFVGADTLIGPIYLAYGHAQGGHDAFYVSLGRTLGQFGLVD